MNGFIYETTYVKTGQKYIGQTTKSGQALDKYFGSGLRIQRIHKKYGDKFFTKRILCECSSKKELDEKEIFYIENYKPELNISTGGNGGNLGEEVNRKLKENHADFSGEKHPNWGKKHSEESKAKMRKSWTNNPRIHSDEWKAEHSNKMLGKNNPMFGKSVYDFMDEKSIISYKKKLSRKSSGKNNFNYGKLGEENHNSRRVKCVELNKTFGGVRDAARELGFKNHSGISQCCQGKRKTSGGYHWEYI